jgi:mannose-6-phosphate isomerase-like protein (cupin superfamily)
MNWKKGNKMSAIIEKPWGFEEILVKESYLVKKLVLRNETSTHYHTTRNELLIPVNGTGEIILNDNIFPLLPFVVVKVDRGVKHNIKPHGYLEIIEVSDKNVDDVVRVSDKHGRIHQPMLGEERKRTSSYMSI